MTANVANKQAIKTRSTHIKHVDNMHLKSHSQDRKITIANSLLMLSEKTSHEMMVNFNIWNDWIQKVLSKLLLGLELIFMVFMFGTDLIWLASDSHLQMSELFSHFIGPRLHPLPVQWRLTPFTPPLLDLQYIFRITNHNNYIGIIYINLYDSFLSSVLCKISPPQPS